MYSTDAQMKNAINSPNFTHIMYNQDELTISRHTLPQSINTTKNQLKFEYRFLSKPLVWFELFLMTGCLLQNIDALMLYFHKKLF